MSTKENLTNPAPLGQQESPEGEEGSASKVSAKQIEVLRYTAKSLRQLGRHFHAEDLEAAFPEMLAARGSK